MKNPLWRLKFLPWLSLAQVSALNILIVIILEFVIWIGATRSYPINRALIFLYSPPLGIIVSLAISLGIGALAVYLLERVYRRVIINTATLWALTLCLFIGLVVKSLLPVPGFLLNLEEIQVICMIVGVFWKSRHYWR